MGSTQETDVGIKLFVSNHSGFQGILKHRFTDFKVFEIDLNGRVASLTPPTPTHTPNPPNSWPNPQPPEKQQLDENCAVTPEAKNAAIIEFEKLVENLEGNFGEQFRKFVEDFDESQSQNNEELILQNINDKQMRTKIHQFFNDQKALPKILSQTIKDEQTDTQSIKIQFRSKIEQKIQQQNKTQKRGKKRGRQASYAAAGYDPRSAEGDWEGGKGLDYVQFTLAKQNEDSQQAMQQIARGLGRDGRAVCFAGNKDKRGLTFQKATIYRVPFQQFRELNKKMRKIKVGDLEYVGQPLQLGALQGNKFEVVLRQVEGNAQGACEQVKNNGFINYYGLQRFGSGVNSTHKVGLALLKGDWKAAVDLILMRNEADKEQVAQAKDLYSQGNIEGASKKMPRGLVGEWNVLNGLVQNGKTNYLEAINKIPRNLRTLYVHSYQAYLWNVAATHRIQHYGGDKVVEGDLVACEQNFIPGIEGEEQKQLSHPREDKIFNVKKLTKEDIESGKYTISDVVLPLPGSKIVYPGHLTTAVIYDTANNDGLPLDAELHRHKDFAMGNLVGDYRKVLIKPQNFEFDLVEYSDVNQDILPNEIEQMNQGLDFERPKKKARVEGEAGKKLEGEEGNIQDSKESTDVQNVNQNELINEPNLKNSNNDTNNNKNSADFSSEVQKSSQSSQNGQAIILKFQLPPSSYATMLIREVTKMDTATMFHKTLSSLTN